MKIGLALNGGGIRGIAHAGVLKALEENGIKIEVIGGTSSGSLVASLYALGFSPYYIYVLFKRYSRVMIEIGGNSIANGIGGFIRNKKLMINGLRTGDSIENAYNEIALKKGVRTITDVKMPLIIPAVDIKSGKEYLFTSVKDVNGERYINDSTLGVAVRASSCFPIIYNPCRYKDYYFLDGGVLNDIPTNEVRQLGAEKVISIVFESNPINEESNIMDIAVRCLDIMSKHISEEKLKTSDYVLEINTDGTGLFDIEKIDLCYKLGYIQTIRKMEEIKQLLLDNN